jgi:hypothetical protein
MGRSGYRAKASPQRHRGTEAQKNAEEKRELRKEKNRVLCVSEFL